MNVYTFCDMSLDLFPSLLTHNIVHIQMTGRVGENEKKYKYIYKLLKNKVNKFFIKLCKKKKKKKQTHTSKG